MQTGFIRIAAAAAVLASAGSAMAFVPWSNPNGSGTNFQWANGGSRNGLFGSPTLVNGDTFVFFPSGFRAQSVGGGSNLVEDRLEFELYAAPGFNITNIRISEFGDYGVIGEGSSVSAGGSLIVTNLDNFDVATNAIVTQPGSPITEEGFGNWRGDAAVELVGWSRVKVIVDNDLIAISGQGGIAYIEKKVFGSGISIQIVPAPGSLALVGLGGMMMLRRRR